MRPSWKLRTTRRRVNAVNVSLARLQLAAWCSNKCDLDPYLTRLLGNGRAVMFHLSNIIKLWTRSSYNFLALSLWLLSRHTQGISTGVPGPIHQRFLLLHYVRQVQVFISGKYIFIYTPWSCCLLTTHFIFQIFIFFVNLLTYPLFNAGVTGIL